MIKSKIFLQLAIVASSAFLVTACVTLSGECSIKATYQVKATSPSPSGDSSSQAMVQAGSGGRTIDFSGSLEAGSIGSAVATLVPSANEAPDAASISLDISGSNVSWPDTGTVTLTIVNKSNGTTTSARSFGWVKSGARLVFSSSSDVNAWLSSSGASVADSRIQYSIDNLPVTTHNGNNVASASIVQNNTSIASSQTAWDEVWHTCGPNGQAICAPR